MISRQKAEREIAKLEKCADDIRKKIWVWRSSDIKRDSQMGKFELKRLRKQQKELHERIVILRSIK